MTDNSLKQQSPQDNRAAQLREDLQQKIVDIITHKLESGEMTEERAKSIAKMTLAKLPEGISYNELMKVVPTIDHEFEELHNAVLPIVVDYQQKIESQIQSKVSELMKQRKYADALILAKQAIEFESKLRPDKSKPSHNE
ncbi:hypothetical protein KC717_01485 [Candidatus Dojkabacteria bacterium]|uniref:Uncharacterized protein n=1 Tax=Candidatus Dojkabacteria bacterium TaxID=2099670 RepID=A0A955RJY3_9BACT|nr:hypothetical protein [Candidatus Dojkabacteria bacterium]